MKIKEGSIRYDPRSKTVSFERERPNNAGQKCFQLRLADLELLVHAAAVKLERQRLPNGNQILQTCAPIPRRLLGLYPFGRQPDGRNAWRWRLDRATFNRECRLARNGFKLPKGDRTAAEGDQTPGFLALAFGRLDPRWRPL